MSIVSSILKREKWYNYNVHELYWSQYLNFLKYLKQIEEKKFMFSKSILRKKTHAYLGVVWEPIGEKDKILDDARHILSNLLLIFVHRYYFVLSIYLMFPVWFSYILQLERTITLKYPTRLQTKTCQSNRLTLSLAGYVVLPETTEKIVDCWLQTPHSFPKRGMTVYTATFLLNYTRLKNIVRKINEYGIH